MLNRRLDSLFVEFHTSKPDIVRVLRMRDTVNLIDDSKLDEVHLKKKIIFKKQMQQFIEEDRRQKKWNR